MHKKCSLAVLLCFIGSLFSPLAPFVHLEKKYHYASEEQVQELHFESVYEPVASLYGKEKLQTKYKRATGTQAFSASKDMFVFRIPKTFAIESEDDIKVSLMIDSPLIRGVPGGRGVTKIPLSLDSDGDGRPEDFYYTEPIFLDQTKHLSYSIETKPGIALVSVSIIGLNTEEYSTHLAFDPEIASADTSGVVKRSEWGADETLRYEDSPTWQRIFAKPQAPKSEATLAYEKKAQGIRTHLAEKFPEQDLAVEKITEESGHPLVWPIEKTKNVERIVIHHTADGNTGSKDDLSLIRGIYYYHTIVHGWGDIGYHYLVGQRGTIYEGRAGGDYAVAAHAVWNNKSTVGISVMGNFMTEWLVQEQETAVKNLVRSLATKYGIDLHKSSTGHQECSAKSDCLVRDFSISNLTGHRDQWYTSCPGDSLFKAIQTIRSEDTFSQGLAYKSNPRIITSSVQVASNTDSLSLVSHATPLAKWPTIRIRLSFTGSIIRLKSADTTLPRLTLGTASGTLRKNLELPFEASGTNKIALVLGKKKYPLSRVEFWANLVQITNWDRKPSWDTTGVYNDNVFRGKISLVNENGTLVAVNELPLEDYLRGLAEVSNNDNVEKMKTILVAARSYAYFYSDPAHRKFPGKAYDGSDNPDEFQKYLGYGYERRSPNAGALVDQTNGQIITYNGVSVKPWYFNESDGRTRSAKEYCENKKINGILSKNTVCEDIPYLQSVSDPGGVGHTQKGHGVGISGIGATYLATTLDFKYDQIIEYYLEGVKVEKKY